MPPPIRGRGRSGVRTQRHRTAFHGVETEQPAKQPRAAGPQQTGNAENLAAMQRERGRAQPVRLEAVEPQQRFADSARRARIQILERTSDHQADDLIAARGGGRPLAGITSIAQHDEAIGHLRHLFDEVRDVHDGQPLLLEPADQIEQLPHVAVREAARRLVEHEHAAAECQGARDFHELLRRRREFSDRRVERNVRVPELIEGRACRSAHGVAVNNAERAEAPPPRRLDTERNVVHHAQVRRERQVLINHGHAGPARFARISRRVRPAVERHRPRVWRDRARENGHQRALARAVLPDQRAHFAAAHGEVHAVERNGAAERLAHAAHVELRACRAEAARRRGYGFNHRARSGCSSSLTAGSDILSRVMSCAPVSMRFSTGRPCR